VSKTFEGVKHALARRNFLLSIHATRELRQDDLLVEKVVAAALIGEVIEDYPDDPRGPSCLICSALGEPGEWVHTVWGWDSASGIAVLITAYRPDPEKWSDDFKTRRR
jgi:Domain of unknown function (DUF4258)